MKIAHKISLSFLATALILTSIAAPIFYMIAKDSLRKSIYNNLDTAVASRTDHIETYLKMLEASVGQLSKSTILENFLKTTGKGDLRQGESFEQAMISLKRTKEANPAISEFLLLDVTGKVIASSNESSVGSDKSTDSIFLAGQKETYIKDAYYSDVDKKPLMAVSTPFLDSQTDELLGVLAARARLNDLNNIVTEKTGMGDTGEIYIVNKYGYMVTPARSKEGVVLKQRVDTENIRKARLHESREHPLSAKKKIDVFPDYRGVQVLGAHEYIPQMQWAVLAEIDSKEAFAPLAKLHLIFLMILFIVPIAAWLLGIFLAKLITGPLHKLHKGTEIIGSGNLDYKVGIDAKDEVGQLSRAFDAMTTNLKTSTTSIENLNKEIAERKKIEEAQKQLIAIIEATPDFVGFADAKDKHIIYVNKAGRKMCGIGNDEDVTKLKIHNVHPEWTNKMFAEKILPAAVRDGIWTGECAFLNIRDRHEIPVSMVLSSHKASNGEVEVFSTISRDITGRKNAEKELRESQKKYMDLFKNANDSIYTMDLIGKFFSFNHTAAELLGYSEEEFSHLNMKDCLTPESYASAVQSIQKAVTEKSDLKELQPWEFKMIKKDGTIIDTEVSTRLIWEEGQIIGILGIARNITERKRTDEELRVAYKELKQTQQDLIQSSKMTAMGQLAAGISHELNQPLTGIKGFAQAVLMDLEKESPLRNDLNKIVGQVDRMDTIIKNVRFFARKSDFKIVELDINQVVSDSLMLLNQQLKTHNIRVIQELGLGIPKMQGDPNQLQQVFLNIISNARDAILSLNRPEGGEIRIQTSLSQDKNHIEITFQDTGCGIPQEGLQQIFSPFFTTKSPDRGMGLGLSITYRIIKNHHGIIDFQTKAGEGTTFRIVLPLKIVTAPVGFRKNKK